MPSNTHSAPTLPRQRMRGGPRVNADDLHHHRKREDNPLPLRRGRMHKERAGERHPIQARRRRNEGPAARALAVHNGVPWAAAAAAFSLALRLSFWTGAPLRSDEASKLMGARPIATDRRPNPIRHYRESHKPIRHSRESHNPLRLQRETHGQGSHCHDTTENHTPHGDTTENHTTHQDATSTHRRHSPRHTGPDHTSIAHTT